MNLYFADIGTWTVHELEVEAFPSERQEILRRYVYFFETAWAAWDYLVQKMTADLAARRQWIAHAKEELFLQRSEFEERRVLLISMEKNRDESGPPVSEKSFFARRRRRRGGKRRRHAA